MGFSWKAGLMRVENRITEEVSKMSKVNVFRERCINISNIGSSR